MAHQGDPRHDGWSRGAWNEARRQFADEDSARRARGRRGPGDGHGPSGGSGHGPLVEQFAMLGQELLDVPPEAGVVGVLERVVHTAHVVVPDADVVSVTMRQPDGSFDTPVETDPLASRADRIQYDTGEGPCLDATADTGVGVVASSDLAHDGQYPVFGPEAAAIGLAAVLSTGMFPGGEPPRLGALNFYSHRRGGLDGVDENMALVLAAHAATALRSARAVEAANLRVAQLTKALQSRDVIGQAKGILMERRGATAEEAFDALRRASQELNVKLRDLAHVIAERRTEL